MEVKIVQHNLITMTSHSSIGTTSAVGVILD